MNLGGPSETCILKNQAVYTPDSGVIKPLSLGNIDLLKNSEAQPLINNKHLKVIPCVLANDGTALKPAIEFDARLKENVGLQFPVDMEYVRTPNPSPEFLKENIVTEALVSSMTSLDNFCLQPVAVNYATQCGKTGQAMSSLFEEQIISLEVCHECLKHASDKRHIVSLEEMNCAECKNAGQVSYLPALRACESCLQNNSVCVRRVVMVLCTECETGNKNAFEKLIEKHDNGTISPELELLCILPDCPHVVKSVKAAFSNWWLNCKGERVNLGLLRTLRNRSSKETKDRFRKLIPKNDHVKNKDRQDPSSVLTLSNSKLTSELKGIGYVCHTIIPELDKYSPDNQRGMYPSPISIGIPSYGWIVFLSYDSKTCSSSLVKARLHSPVDRITILRKHLHAKHLHCAEGIIFLITESGHIVGVEFKEGTIHMTWNNKKKKADLVDQATKINISTGGIAVEIASRIKKHLENVKRKYSSKNVQTDVVHVWGREIQPCFEAMTCVDSSLIYAAETRQRSIVSLQVERDGVGLMGTNLQPVAPYGSTWQTINSMSITDGILFVAHDQGITKINLATSESRTVVHLDSQLCVLASFRNGAIFTNQMTATIWQISCCDSENDDEVTLFAGSEGVDGCVDGPVQECKFKQPMGICTEFDNVVFVCDAQTNSVKIITKMEECARFLGAIGCLFKAFSVHEKGVQYTVQSIEEAILLVQRCNTVMEENTVDIRRTTGIKTTLNGPEGHVAARTVASLSLIEKGLSKLADHLKTFNYKHVNLLSCVTLDVENCHSIVHTKQANMSMAEYCKAFGTTMKESIKS